MAVQRMRFDSLINGTDSVAVEKAAATQAVVTLHRVAADCSSACGKHALSCVGDCALGGCLG